MAVASCQAGRGRLSSPHRVTCFSTDEDVTVQAHRPGRGALLRVTLPFGDLASTSLTKISVFARSGWNVAQHFAKPESR